MDLKTLLHQRKGFHLQEQARTQEGEGASSTPVQKDTAGCSMIQEAGSVWKMKVRPGSFGCEKVDNVFEVLRTRSLPIDFNLGQVKTLA